ncbi:DUF350 domain-containing protein [Magnetococcales bacterium HHB-1]
MTAILTWFLYGTGYFAVALLLLIIGRWVYDLATPYEIREELKEHQNSAIALALIGYLGGLIAVICGVFTDDSSIPLTLNHFLDDLQPILLYAILGMGALLLVGPINDRLILYRFSITPELVQHQNSGVGAVLLATNLGSGLIIAGGIHGSVNLTLFLLAFILGQLGLTLYSWLYRAVTRHDEMMELKEHRNVAVGIAWGGNLIGYSIILMTGLAQGGDLYERIVYFLYYAILGLLLLPIARFILNRYLIKGMMLRPALIEDHNVGVGMIKGGAAICVALVLVYCF